MPNARDIQRAAEAEAAAGLNLPGTGLPVDELAEMLYPGGQVEPRLAGTAVVEPGQEPEPTPPAEEPEVTAEEQPTAYTAADYATPTEYVLDGNYPIAVATE